jgi:pimeloyl-ACP methyl ester carboxylesterase
VIHDTADLMFPLEHGQALANEIPGASLLPLEGSGHGVERADWETIVRAVLAHTAGRAT